MQILDIVDVDSSVFVIGKTIDGEVKTIKVEEINHVLYVRDNHKTLDDFRLIAENINRRSIKFECRRFGCCSTKRSPNGVIFRESCSKNINLTGDTIKFNGVIEAYGFDFFEAKKSKYGVFSFKNGRLLSYLQNFECFKYNDLKSSLEAFQREYDLASFDWVDDNLKKVEGEGVANFKTMYIQLVSGRIEAFVASSPLVFESFSDFIFFFKKEDPDFVVSFKCSTVWLTLFQKAKETGMVELFQSITRIEGEPLLFSKRNHMVDGEDTIDCPGRVFVDLKDYLNLADFYLFDQKSVFDSFGVEMSVMGLKALTERLGVIDQLKSESSTFRIRARDLKEKGSTFHTKRMLAKSLKNKYIPFSMENTNVTAQKQVEGCLKLKQFVNLNKYIGGYVIEPRYIGIYRFPVVILDFKSMYPNIMRVFNICKSTLVPSDVLPRGYIQTPVISTREDGEATIFEIEGFKFSTDVIGVIPALMDSLLNEREKLPKKSSQGLSLKKAMNTIYGKLGSNYSRTDLYCVCCAQTITNIGRVLIEIVSSFVSKYSKEALPCEVVYGDTDSVFVGFKELPTDVSLFRDYVNKEIEDYILKFFNIKNCGRLSMDISCVSDGCIFISKKRYFLFTQSGGVEAVGICKRENCKYVNSIVSKVVEKILKDKVSDFEELEEFAFGEWEAGLSKADKELFLMSNTISDSQEKKGDHVIAYEQLKQTLEIETPPGERIGYYYVEVDGSNKRSERVVESHLFGSEDKISYQDYKNDLVSVLSHFLPLKNGVAQKNTSNEKRMKLVAKNKAEQFTLHAFFS